MSTDLDSHSWRRGVKTWDLGGGWRLTEALELRLTGRNLADRRYSAVAGRARLDDDDRTPVSRLGAEGFRQRRPPDVAPEDHHSSPGERQRLDGREARLSIK